MTEYSAAGFWSYAHDDNESDAGGILELAGRLKAEFLLLTGDQLTLFVDRDGISWGDEWRTRINNALVETTFFIPLITPRYFKRPECRRELLSFVGQAESLGIVELVLPILYADVPSLAVDNDDEAVALVARMQYVDWRELRIAGQSSAEYRAALNQLAKRLVDISSRVSQKQVVSERAKTRADAAEIPTDDLVELMQRVDSLLPDWIEAVQADIVLTAQHDATTSVHQDRMHRLAGAPASARFAQLQRYAVEELKLAERNLATANEYLARTVELDPIVSAIIRIAVEHRDTLPLIENLIIAITDAYERAVNHLDLLPRPGMETMQHYAKRNSHVSRTMRQMGEMYEKGTAVILDANAIVVGWHEAFEALRKDVEGCVES